MFHLFKQLIAFVILILLFDQSYGEESKQLAEMKLEPINSHEEAYEQALRLTGFDKSEDFKRSNHIENICSPIISRDSTTAFIANKISNRAAWQIELQKITLHLKGNTPDGRILGPVDFIVIIDSLTGIPLRINSISTMLLDREPIAAVAEAQLSNMGEKYVDLPQQYPLFTVKEVLDWCKFYPALAKKIIINYVLYSKDDSLPQPAWVIYLRGLPPKSSSYPRPDLDYTTTNTRYVFGATKKTLLEHNNLPYRLLSNDK